MAELSGIEHRGRSAAGTGAPAYRAAEAAHILLLPAATISAWCFGQQYRQRSDGKSKRFQRVIEPADARHKLLSFTNLCELHLLGVIRRRHRVTLPQVRKALVFIRQRLDEPRPLASSRFRTDGVDLFVEHAGVLLNVSRSGQQALREDFERALTRIEFGPADRPVVLFPLTRESPTNIEQPKTVLVDPLRSFVRSDARCSRASMSAPK